MAADVNRVYVLSWLPAESVIRTTAPWIVTRDVSVISCVGLTSGTS